MKSRFPRVWGLFLNEAYLQMKRKFTLLFFVFALSACSMNMDQLLGRQPTLIPAPTSRNTSTAAPTFTPTVPSPTFTVTPTMVGLKAKTATLDSSPTPLMFTQPGVTLLPTNTPLVLVPQVNMVGFVSVSVSSEVFYKGKECLPGSVMFTAQVADAAGVGFVVLFVRFKSKLTGTTSEWTSIEMQRGNVPGFFTHELAPLEMKAVDGFENAWVQYQLVATDGNAKQIGRTDIFDERLALLNCVVTPTPSPSITPTVLVP
jgi:hypothetical protein